MDVHIVNIEGKSLAGLEWVGAYSGIGKVFRKLVGICMREGLFTSDSEMIAIFFDDPKTVPVEKLRSAACISINMEAAKVGNSAADADVGATAGDSAAGAGNSGAGAGLRVPDSLRRFSIEAGEYARGIHKGPYRKLGATYTQIEEWIAQAGRVKRDAPGFDIYRNNPFTTLPWNLITEVYYPV